MAKTYGKYQGYAVALKVARLKDRLFWTGSRWTNNLRAIEVYDRKADAQKVLKQLGLWDNKVVVRLTITAEETK